MLHDTLASESIQVGQLIIPGAIQPGHPTHDPDVLAGRLWHLHTQRTNSGSSPTTCPQPPEYVTFGGHRDAASRTRPPNVACGRMTSRMARRAPTRKSVTCSGPTRTSELRKSERNGPSPPWTCRRPGTPSQGQQQCAADRPSSSRWDIEGHGLSLLVLSERRLSATSVHSSPPAHRFGQGDPGRTHGPVPAPQRTRVRVGKGQRRELMSMTKRYRTSEASTRS
jgi:hypothetical protein